MSFFDDTPLGAQGRLNFGPEPLYGVAPFVVLYKRADTPTPVTLNVGIGSRTNVPGTRLILRHLGLWLIHGMFGWAGDVLDNAATGRLEIDGSAPTNIVAAEHELNDGSFQPIWTTSVIWFIEKVTPGDTVLQLTVFKTGGTGASVCRTLNTAIAAWTVPGSLAILPSDGT